MLTPKEKRRALELARGEIYAPSTIADPDGINPDGLAGAEVGDPEDDRFLRAAWWVLGGGLLAVAAIGVVLVIAWWLS